MEMIGVVNGFSLKGWRNAELMLVHYLDGGGADYVVDVNALMNEVPGFAAAVLAYVADQAGKKSFDSSDTYEHTINISTDTDAKDASGHLIQQNYDWYYAMHDFRYRVTGHSENPDGTGNIHYTVEVSKSYVFHPDHPDLKIPHTGLVVKQGDIAHLNTTGNATDFYIKGAAEFEYDVTK
jgi:hypothetical protein